MGIAKKVICIDCGAEFEKQSIRKGAKCPKCKSENIKYEKDLKKEVDNNDKLDKKENFAPENVNNISNITESSVSENNNNASQPKSDNDIHTTHTDVSYPKNTKTTDNIAEKEPKEIKKEEKEPQFQEFEIEDLEMIETPEDIITQPSSVEDRRNDYLPKNEEDKEERKKKIKANNKGAEMIARVWVESHKILYKKLNKEIKDNDFDMLQEYTEEAIKYYFPASKGKLNPVWGFALAEGMMILPLVPDILKSYREFKASNNKVQQVQPQPQQVQQVQPQENAMLEYSQEERQQDDDEAKQRANNYLARYG